MVTLRGGGIEGFLNGSLEGTNTGKSSEVVTSILVDISPRDLILRDLSISGIADGSLDGLGGDGEFELVQDGWGGSWLGWGPWLGT